MSFILVIMVQSEAGHTLKTSLFKSSERDISKRRKKAMRIPAANMDESGNEYILTIASPGFKRENFQVMIDKDMITIAAAKETTGQICIHDHCEYDYTNWKRAFSLPDDADPLLTRARYKNGELIVRIPRGKTDKLSGITKIYVY